MKESDQKKCLPGLFETRPAIIRKLWLTTMVMNNNNNWFCVCGRQNSFVMTVESNHVIALVLVFFGFLIGSENAE